MNGTKNWYVLYTNPKSEKKVADRLTKIGVLVFCPLVTKVSQWSDRKKKVQLPLFTSYIFVNLAEKNRNIVFDIAGAVRYMFWLGKPAIVKDKEIETIQNWLMIPDTFDVTIDAWKKGDKVILESGPFMDHKAIVQEVKQKQYILVLESLGCVLKVEKK